MWVLTQETEKSEAVTNKILSQTSKPELAYYLHASLFSPTFESFIKTTKQGLLKTWTGLAETFIKRYIGKFRNTTMGHLHMRRQGLQTTKINLLV